MRRWDFWVSSSILKPKLELLGKSAEIKRHTENIPKEFVQNTPLSNIYIQNKDIVTMFGSRRNSVPRGKKLDRNELWQDIRVEFDLSKTYVLLYHTKYNSIKNHHTISIITSKLITQYQ